MGTRGPRVAPLNTRSTGGIPRARAGAHRPGASRHHLTPGSIDLEEADAGGGLVTSVGAWVRNRRSDVTVEVTVADRTVRVEGKRIKADADSLAALVVEANRAADGH